jgi:DNA-binding NarL/FixJ family response regulator
MSELNIRSSGKDVARVAILNSSALVCKGLEFVIEPIENLTLVGSATTTEEALALCRKLSPDLVITDVKTPLLDGILITQTVKDEAPHVKVLILTAISDDQQIFEALWSGADGYCLNDVSSEKVKNAIQSVLSGAIWLDSAIASSIKKGASDLRGSSLSKPSSTIPIPSGQEGLSGLTEREIEVLELISLGYSNSRIGVELLISAETVKTHIRHIMRKLAVTDRTQAAVIALKRRIVQ